MAEIVKINSKKGMVSLTQKDISENDLAPWLRTNSKGFGHYSFINQQPFERVAAKLFVDKYPSTHVKVAESIVCTKEGGVNVFLRITDDFSKGNYNTHPTKLVFNKGKQTVIEDIAKHGYDEFSFEKLAEDLTGVEDISEENSDEGFYSEIEDFLSEVKNLSEEDLIKKVSPEELENISKMLDLDSESEEDDFDDVEGEDDFEGDEGNDGDEGDFDDLGEDEGDLDIDIEIEGDNDNEGNEDGEFEDKSPGEDVLKTVNLDDFSEEVKPKILDIKEVGPSNKIPEDKTLRNIIKEILG